MIALIGRIGGGCDTTRLTDGRHLRDITHGERNSCIGRRERKFEISSPLIREADG